MSQLLKEIIQLAGAGRVRISEHGYDELAEDGLSAREVVAGLVHGKVVEDYPDYPKGPCVLVLVQDRGGKPVHALWGIPKGHTSPAVLITAYRPDPNRWGEKFLNRIDS